MSSFGQNKASDMKPTILRITIRSSDQAGVVQWCDAGRPHASATRGSTVRRRNCGTGVIPADDVEAAPAAIEEYNGDCTRRKGDRSALFIKDDHLKTKEQKALSCGVELEHVPPRKKNKQ